MAGEHFFSPLCRSYPGSTPTLLRNTEPYCRPFTVLQNLHPPNPVAPQRCARTSLQMICCHCALNSDLNRTLWGRSVPSTLDRKASVNICYKQTTTFALPAVSKHIHAGMNIHDYQETGNAMATGLVLASGFSFNQSWLLLETRVQKTEEVNSLHSITIC